jgi:CRP-like cAMP-binding protein
MSETPGQPNALLVNYAGYVLTGNTFVPDNSLATLAAALLDQGVRAQVWDLQNPTDIGSILDDADPSPGLRVVQALEAGQGIERPLFDEYMGVRRKAQRRFEDAQARALVDRIAADGVSMVGFKLWGGNGLAGTVRMAEAVRAAHPHVRLVAGGPAVGYGRELILKRAPVFDALVYGDGEEAVVALARGEMDAPGVIRREGGRVIHTPPRYGRHLDGIPAPRYDPQTYPGVEGFLRMRILDDSRGCFNRCAFCSHMHLSGVTRMKSPARVVDEMEQGLREGVSYFRLSGSNPPRKFLENVAREILRRGLSVRYGVYASMNNARPETMELLADSGLRGLFFGIESGDPWLLSEMLHKNNRSREHMVAVAEAAMGAGIFTCMSVIVPSPCETESTKRATLDLLQAMFERHRHGSVLVLPAFLTPGSAWWERPDAFGFELAPGFDKEALALHLLEWDANFLLPQDLADDAGYRLNGRPCSELFAETQEFVEALEASGIPTNVDDASFMVGLMGNMEVRGYKTAVLSHLVLGGSGPLTRLVERLNGAAGTARDRISASLSLGEGGTRFSQPYPGGVPPRASRSDPTARIPPPREHRFAMSSGPHPRGSRPRALQSRRPATARPEDDPGQPGGGEYLRDMDLHSTNGNASAACPDCPATRLEVFTGLVLNGGCHFQCLALEGRQPMPGSWFTKYWMGLVRRGVVVRQRVDRQGRVTSVDAAGPGCMFLFSDPREATQVSTVSGYAATDVRLCLITRDTLGKALSEPEVSGDLLRMQADTLERVERFADARGRSSAEGRIAAVLTTLADTLSPPRQRDRIPADFQQRDIARLSGLRHETVCRLLGEMERRGAVQRDPEGLRIQDREALETL